MVVLLCACLDFATEMQRLDSANAKPLVKQDDNDKWNDSTDLVAPKNGAPKEYQMT
jgi:hypothetical protein